VRRAREALAGNQAAWRQRHGASASGTGTGTGSQGERRWTRAAIVRLHDDRCGGGH
jgi:hypothetical protein